MRPVEIVNPVPADDMLGWFRVVRRALLHDTYDRLEERVERRLKHLDLTRCWGARDDGTWVGTLATQERHLTVPGLGAATNDLTVDALTLVGVAGTHRRRGLLTRMLGASLQAAADRGDALSVLIAAEWPIYGRFGYAPATDSARYRYRTRRPGAAVAAAEPGRVRHVEPEDLIAVVVDVFDAARHGRAGQMDRAEHWWQVMFGLGGMSLLEGKPANWLVHDGPDGVDGILSWTVGRDFELDRLGAIEVGTLAAATDDAYRDLWAYLSTLDGVEEVVLADRPVDEPARWLMADGRALELEATYDVLWARLLDVPAAFSARGYATAGDVVIEVVDDAVVPYVPGRYRLSAGDDGTGTCTTTTDPADVRVSQRALASAYLGGHRLVTRAVSGEVAESTAGSLVRLDAMLATPRPPWNQTWF